MTRAGRWSLAWLLLAGLQMWTAAYAASSKDALAAVLFGAWAVGSAWLGGFAYGDPRTNAPRGER